MGGLREFTIVSKIHQGARLLRGLTAAGRTVEGCRTVEIGTGWSPVIPLLLWVYGQRKCDTYDITALMKPALVRETLAQFWQRRDLVLAAAPTAKARTNAVERLNALQGSVDARRPITEILSRCGIGYHGSSDAAATGLRRGSVEIVYSNTVLEHVPLPDVHRLFAEARRILAPDGAMAHVIDPSDHFSHTDRSISSINFLTYSDAVFDRFNSRFLFQNRLRAPMWRQVIEAAQFRIEHWDAHVDRDALRALPHIGIDPAFAGISPEELCTTSVCVVAKPQP
jgi:hypothetical protein